MEIEVSVSILNILNKENFAQIVYNLEASGVDYFHIDVMDGKFVENNNLLVLNVIPFVSTSTPSFSS